MRRCHRRLPIFSSGHLKARHGHPDQVQKYIYDICTSKHIQTDKMNKMFIMTIDSGPSTNPRLNPQWLSWHPQTIERGESATPNLKLPKQGFAHSWRQCDLWLILICPSLSNIISGFDIHRLNLSWSLHPTPNPAPRCSFPAATKVINHLWDYGARLSINKHPTVQGLDIEYIIWIIYEYKDTGWYK